MRSLLIDGRSAAHDRTTGWERYTRELVRRVVGQPTVEVVGSRVGSPARRLFDDNWTLPTASRRHSVAHFPSFPPLHFPNQVEILYTLYDLTWWRYPQTASAMGRHYYRPLAERAVQRSTVLTISETVACEIRDFFGLPSERVIATPLGSSLPTDVAPLVRDRPYVLSVASVEPRKNLDRLVRAYETSDLRHTHDLILVGRQAWGALPAGAHLLAGVDDHSLARLYAGASATILVSLYEGFGLPVLESLAAGTPVICSDIPVFHEVAGASATYVDPLRVDDLVDSMSLVPSLARPNATQVAHFRSKTWDKTVDQITATYRDLGVDVFASPEQSPG